MTKYLTDEIKLRAKTQGITLDKIAEELDVSTAVVSKWLNYKSTPSLERLIEMADVVGLELVLVDKYERSIQGLPDTSKLEAKEEIIESIEKLLVYLKKN